MLGEEFDEGGVSFAVDGLFAEIDGEPARSVERIRQSGRAGSVEGILSIRSCGRLGDD